MKQHDDSRKSTFESGGQRIDDHKFWAGGPGKDMVMPSGVHTKSEKSADGAGSLRVYEDSTEQIKESQDMAEKQIKKYPRKHLERN
jgi:hypothetical protein